MKVIELIAELEKHNADSTVYIEDSAEFSVLDERCPGNNTIVRIYKPWDCEFLLGSAGLKEDTDAAD